MCSLPAKASNATYTRPWPQSFKNIATKSKNLMESDFDNIEFEITVDKRMLLPENVVTFFSGLLNDIQRSFNKDGYDLSKKKINSIANFVFSQAYDEKLKYELLLLLVPKMIRFGKHFVSTETLNNVLSVLEKEKTYLASKNPFEYKYYLSYALFIRFNTTIHGTDEVQLDSSGLTDLIQAKFHLQKVLLHTRTEKMTISKSQEMDALSLLCAILSQLSRWAEVISILENHLLSATKENQGQIKYLLVISLFDIKEKTCLTYNALFLLRIIELCSEVEQHPALNEQKIRCRFIKDSCIEDCKKYNVDLDEIEKHRKEVRSNKSQVYDFQAFFKSNGLMLNEHSFYCDCKKSYYDDIQFQTSHLHTKIEWVEKKQPILENILSEYNLARIEYYRSLEETSLRGFGILGASRNRTLFKHQLLLSSFRKCYSILDSIGMAVLSSFDIDDSKFPKLRNGRNVDLYFLNMWDYDLISGTSFKKNQFLHSLYSITKDLDRDKDISAFKEFKKIRNDIEHKIFLISEHKVDGCKSVSPKLMYEYTDTLLKLTRSAIFSFVYFIRRESTFRYQK